MIHATTVPPNAKKQMSPISGHGPLADGPALSDENQEPIRLVRLGPVSHRLGSRSVPQTAQPAANGLTGSRQLGHRLRSGIAHRIARARRLANRIIVYVKRVTIPAITNAPAHSHSVFSHAWRSTATPSFS